MSFFNFIIWYRWVLTSVLFFSLLKQVDLTETSGIGLLGEMSVAEVYLILNDLKISEYFNSKCDTTVIILVKFCNVISCQKCTKKALKI